MPDVRRKKLEFWAGFGTAAIGLITQMGSHREMWSREIGLVGSLFLLTGVVIMLRSRRT